MKALAKVYPLLGNGKFFAGFLSFVVIAFAFYLWQKPLSPTSIPQEVSISFTAGSFSRTLGFKESIEMLPFEFEKIHWNVAVLKTASLGNTLNHLLQKNRAEKKPFVGFIRDAQDKDYIFFISQEGALTVSSVAALSKSAQLSFPNGLEVKIPEEMGQGAFYFRGFLPPSLK